LLAAVKVTEQQTKEDFAQCLLVDSHFPEAEGIRVGLDKRNIHRPAALYETFPPQEARGILGKLEFHATPKDGRWLNEVATLEGEVAAWEKERNEPGASVHERFRVGNARTKLSRFYPS